MSEMDVDPTVQQGPPSSFSNAQQQVDHGATTPTPSIDLSHVYALLTASMGNDAAAKFRHLYQVLCGQHQVAVHPSAQEQTTSTPAALTAQPATMFKFPPPVDDSYLIFLAILVDPALFSLVLQKEGGEMAKQIKLPSIDAKAHGHLSRYPKYLLRVFPYLWDGIVPFLFRGHSYTGVQLLPSVKLTVELDPRPSSQAQNSYYIARGMTRLLWLFAVRVITLMGTNPGEFVFPVRFMVSLVNDSAQKQQQPPLSVNGTPNPTTSKCRFQLDLISVASKELTGIANEPTPQTWVRNVLAILKSTQTSHYRLIEHQLSTIMPRDIWTAFQKRLFAITGESTVEAALLQHPLVNIVFALLGEKEVCNWTAQALVKMMWAKAKSTGRNGDEANPDVPAGFTHQLRKVYSYCNLLNTPEFFNACIAHKTVVSAEKLAIKSTEVGMEAQLRSLGRQIVQGCFRFVLNAHRHALDGNVTVPVAVVYNPVDVSEENPLVVTIQFFRLSLSTLREMKVKTSINAFSQQSNALEARKEGQNS